MRRWLVVAVAVVVAGCSSTPTGTDGGTGGGSGGSGGGSAAGGGSGTGGGGSGGSGGGTAGPTCSARGATYASALQAAKACNTTSLVNPCTVTRPASVTCGCPTFIDSSSAGPVDLAQAQFSDAGCMPMVCPSCLKVDAGDCVPVDGGQPSEGRCIDLY